MKILIQRVKQAHVTVDEKKVGQITSGLLIYICFETHDSLEIIDLAVKKIIGLRIFEDKDGKMNTNISQVQGQILSISQFTLSWNGKKGHRPSFDKSMPPNDAKIFYRKFNDTIEKYGIKLAKGMFGTEMQVSSINDGPVTFFLDY